MPSNRIDLTTDRLLKLLSAEWQKVEDLMPEVMGTVPSGFALRTYETRTKTNKGVKVSTDDEKIASGKRTIANTRKIHLMKAGRIEQRIDDDGTRWIRFTAEELERQRQEYEASLVCSECHRPFTQATENPTPAPSPQEGRVLYPAFPQWGQRKEAVT